MIFETQRLLIRKLKLDDLEPFHLLENNPKVLKFAIGQVKGLEGNKKELLNLIARYEKHLNDFWIYAVVRKSDDIFIGTLALVKDNIDNEIGYRLIEKYWGLGFGYELCKGTLKYCKQIGIKKLVAYCVDENIASAKILKKLGFAIVKHFISDDINLPETKYEIKL